MVHGIAAQKAIITSSFFMSEEKRIGRRRMIGGLGMSLVAATAPQAFAADQSNERQSSSFEKLQDPTTKCPKPPFKEQLQPWPGLASKMDPPPDHGEKSYKGSGRLLGGKP
jgi:hypothetical protein